MQTTALDRQAKRIRWKTGLPPHIARTLAQLAYGGSRA